MFSDDKSDYDISPVEGTGEEMIPDKGLPFEDVDDPMEGMLAQLDDMDDEDARDLTPEELTELLGGEQGTEDFLAEIVDQESGQMSEVDGGMGAVEPIFRDNQLEEEIGLPDSELRTPPPASIAGMPVPSSLTNWDPSVTSAVPTTLVGETSQDLDAEDQILKMLITKERVLRLWDRIDEVQKMIREKIPSLELARDMYDQIETARNEILAGRQNYEEAERALNEVELRIAIVGQSKRDAPIATALFFYEVIWAVVFFVSASMMSQGTFPGVTTAGLEIGFSAIFGGFGGVVGAFYTLWRHVSRELDFHRQYFMWFLSNPLMGIILGIFVYAVMQTGLSSLYGGIGQADVSNPWIIYMLAFVVGYQQNVAWDLIRRIIRVIFQISPEQS